MFIRHSGTNLVATLMPELYRELVIVNKLGLHLRPIRLLVDTANGFSSAVRIAEGDREVDGKSFLEVMSLAVPMNTKLRFSADGADAEAALDALQELIDGKFNED